MRTSVAIVLGIFIVAAVALLTSVPNLYISANRSMRLAYVATADACAGQLAARPPDPVILSDLLRRYGLVAIVIRDGRTNQVVMTQGSFHATSHAEVRMAGPNKVELYFPTGELRQAASSVRAAAIAGAAATLSGILLLILYGSNLLGLDRSASRDTAPHERLSETSYLIETFGTSIRTLKGRESELRELHDREKQRANELGAVTATLTRSLTTGFMAIDDRGRVLDMNQHARMLVGLRPEEPVANRTIREAAGDTPFSRALQQAIDERQSLERIEIAGNSEDSIIGLSTVLLLDDQGRHFGMLALFTDLSPVRRLENRVRDLQSLADLGEMSAGIAHEFRNSLSTVLGYLKLARKEALPPAAQQRLEHAETEAKSLAEALERLLVFSSPLSLHMQEVGAIELLEPLVARYASLHPGIRFQLFGPDAPIQADAALLARAFENVIRNAVDSISEKLDERGEGGEPGQVTLEVATGADVQITVTDNGVGIDEQDAAKLLLPFQSQKRNGFGLGLSLTRKIVLLHGGTIRLTGRKGSGASVVMEFPLAVPEFLSS